jgi:hypothetical protein
MKTKLLTIILAIIVITTNGQNEIDALRYSTQQLTGTARYSAMGGAFGSLGGEFSALSSNPAGIGMYQFAEFTFTPAFNLKSNKSYFNDSKVNSYKSGLSIGNIGLIFSLPKNKSDWKRINFGIGWNQLANYNSKINIEGINSKSSIVDRILALTNGTLTGELMNGGGNSYSQMAWNTYLIDPLYTNNVLVDGEYVTNFSKSTKMQSKSTLSSGGMNEFVLSVGGSYQEKLYLGATLGIPTIDYYEYSEYSESEILDTSNNLRQMLLSEEISAYGTGYNLKLGAIYRLAENIKIGISLHTPTFFSIEEDYNTSITTFFKDSTLDYSLGYLNLFYYDLITPLKASISASSIFNNILLSAEYEIIDYSKTKYFTTDFEEENLTISNIYQKSENIKLGAEINIKPFILRVGYSKYGSPLIEKEFGNENFSYGMGMNNGSYFIDIAYVLSKRKNEHFLYSQSPISIVSTEHNIIFTLGFRY